MPVMLPIVSMNETCQMSIVETHVNGVSSVHEQLHDVEFVHSFLRHRCDMIELLYRRSVNRFQKQFLV